MAQFDLEKLVQERKEILKVKLFMFLHDIGKLQPGHQAKFIRGYQPPHFATKFNHSKDILNHPVLQRILSWNTSLPPNITQVSFASVIEKHHGATEKSDGIWPVFAQRVDRMDSGWDRDSIISTGVQPLKVFIAIDNPFGWTRMAYQRVDHLSAIKCGEQIPWSLYYVGPTKFDEQEQDCLERLFRCLVSFVQGQANSGSSSPKISVFRHTHRDILRVITEKACGDTRYTVNDITLWDHSISTAILLKILAAWIVASGPKLANNRQFPRSDDNRFENWFRPQLLSLRIDGLGYLAASNNIPDLLARRELLQKVYNTWQDILEWEFPLAGEVYRDENGPVFLTFLRDENGQNAIHLSALTLPRDANGPEHVLPEIYQELIKTQKSPSLEDYLRRAIVELMQGDLTLPPNIPLYTYTQKRNGRPDEKSLGDLLAEEQRQGIWFQADVETIQQAWEQKARELCSVCGLRPLGFGATNQNNEQKAISRGMCGVCLERRVKRAEKWAQGIHKSSQKRLQEGHPETVWLDEVADKNGRLALIVGYFPLERWLDGTLIESLGMFKQSGAEAPPTNRRVSVADELEVVLGPKPVSYSRIRRVWETTRRFWQDVAPTDAPPKDLEAFCKNNGLKLEDLWEGPLSLEKSLAGRAIGEKRSRLFLKGALGKGALGSFHAYEMMVQGRKVAVLWVPPDAVDEKGNPLSHRGGFWVIENLDYLKTQFGRDFQKALREGETYEIYEPSEYGRPGKATDRFVLEEQKKGPEYTPLIPILAEPRTFMALVPADKAVDVVRAIKAKYEREMGKVRNRLPLHLGIVFADAHQPLRTILDAGRRMLRQEGAIFPWRVVGDKEKKELEKKGIYLKHITEKNIPESRLEQERPDLIYEDPERRRNCLTEQYKQWHRIVLFSEHTHQIITWYVPERMGDGQTEDNWYPYVFLTQDGEPTDRNLYYQAPNPFNLDSNGHPQPGWLVHAGELQPGDVVYFTPATLDFIFLDHAGRRFEIAYDDRGRRRGTMLRPYLLDELEDLIQCWKLLAGDREKKIRRLSTTQLHAVRDLVENKRMEWFENPEDSLTDETFRRFCESVLQNVEWQTRPTESEFARLTHWAVTGLLADTVELFYHILKERPVGEEEGMS